MHRCDYRVSVVRDVGIRPTERTPDSAINVGENQGMILRAETSLLLRCSEKNRDLRRISLVAFALFSKQRGEPLDSACSVFVRNERVTLKLH